MHKQCLIQKTSVKIGVVLNEHKIHESEQAVKVSRCQAVDDFAFATLTGWQEIDGWG